MKVAKRVSMGAAGCPAGKIRRGAYRRAGYIRKDGTRVKGAAVPSACVVDRGAPGKTPAAKKFAKFPKKAAYMPGWGKDVSEGKRHSALKNLTKKVGCLRAQRMLLQLANVTTDKPTESKARTDRKWLVSQGFCELKTKK